jgi:SAM-dependent methyltransferase
MGLQSPVRRSNPANRSSRHNVLNSLLKSIFGSSASARRETGGDVLQSFRTLAGESCGTAYAEAPTEPHISITREYMEIAIDKFGLAGRVLDVGCGQGMALERMIARGLDPVGITLGEDFRICAGKKLPVLEMDMNLMDFAAGSFDGIWCRHALEHSIAPYFVIRRMWEFLRPGGLCYVEVPAPDTPCHHETNQNHYSVLTQSMWQSLFARARFQVLEVRTLSFNTPSGEDSYYVFFLRK